MSGADSLVSVAAVCALCAALCATIKKHSPEHALLLSLGCAAAVALAVLPALGSIKDELAALAKGMDGELLGCVVKAAGACLIAQFAGDACIEAGQGALAGRVAFAGRALCIVFALPLFKELALLVSELTAL